VTCATPPAQTPGDCQRLDCVDGGIVSTDDPNDVPARQGRCGDGVCEGVPLAPKIVDLSALCVAGEVCRDTACECTSCPNGVASAGVVGRCLMPAGALATATANISGGEPALMIDGKPDTSFNSGTFDAKIDVSFQSSQVMERLILLPGGGAAPPATSFEVDYKITFTGPRGIAQEKQASYSSAQPLRVVEVVISPMEVNAIRIDARSEQSWIGIYELYFRVCAPGG
jgi:hypothetical protein